MGSRGRMHHVPEQVLIGARTDRRRRRTGCRCEVQTLQAGGFDVAEAIRCRTPHHLVEQAEGVAVAAKVAIDVWALRPAWDALVNDALAEATLTRPNFHGYVTEGKVGLHSEHLSYLLGEMQGLARAHPGATW